MPAGYWIAHWHGDAVDIVVECSVRVRHPVVGATCADLLPVANAGAVVVISLAIDWIEVRVSASTGSASSTPMRSQRHDR